MKNIIKIIKATLFSLVLFNLSLNAATNNEQVSLILKGINQAKVKDFIIQEELIIRNLNKEILDNPKTVYPDVILKDINNLDLTVELDIKNGYIVFKDIFKTSLYKNDLYDIYNNFQRKYGFVSGSDYIVPFDSNVLNLLYIINNIETNGVFSDLELSNSDKALNKLWYKANKDSSVVINKWNSTDLIWNKVININTYDKTLYLDGTAGLDIQKILGIFGQKMIVSLANNQVKEYKYYNQEWVEVYVTGNISSNLESGENVYVSSTSAEVMDAKYNDILDIDKLYYNKDIGTELYINTKEIIFLYDNKIRDVNKYEPEINEFIRFIKQPGFWAGDKTYHYENINSSYDLKIIITDSISNLPTYLDNYIYVLKGNINPEGVKINGVSFKSVDTFSSLNISLSSKYFIRENGIILEGYKKDSSFFPFLTDNKTIALTEGDIVDIQTFDKKENILYLYKIGSGIKSGILGLEEFYSKAKNKSTGGYINVINCPDISVTSNCIAFSDTVLSQPYTTIYNKDIGLAWRMDYEYKPPHNVSWVNSYFNGKDRWIKRNKYNPYSISYIGEDIKYSFYNLFSETNKKNAYIIEENNYELNNIYKIRSNDATRITYSGGELNIRDQFFTYYGWDSDVGAVVGRTAPLRFYYYKDWKDGYTQNEGACCGCWFNCDSCTDCSAVYYPDYFLNQYVYTAGAISPESTELGYPTISTYTNHIIENTRTTSYVLNPYFWNTNIYYYPTEAYLKLTMGEIVSNEREETNTFTFDLSSSTREQVPYSNGVYDSITGTYPKIKYKIYDYTPEKLIENCTLKTSGRDKCKFLGEPFNGVSSLWKLFP